MSTPKHTPGPWMVKPSHHSEWYNWVDTEKGDSVCATTAAGIPRLEAIENAHLIAAAPDLLSALKFITEKCSLYGPADRAREMAEKAITKAEPK